MKKIFLISTIVVLLLLAIVDSVYARTFDPGLESSRTMKIFALGLFSNSIEYPNEYAPDMHNIVIPDIEILGEGLVVDEQTDDEQTGEEKTGDDQTSDDQTDEEPSGDELTIDEPPDTDTKPVLVVETPKELVVHGTRKDTNIECYVTLQETGGDFPVTGINSFINPIILSDSDKTVFFPEDAIEIEVVPDIEPDRRVKMKITIDLSKVERSGIYGGEIILKSNSVSDVVIPITLAIKDRPLWAVYILILSISIGGVLNYYITSVKKKDEICVRIDNLLVEVENHENFKKYCGSKVNDQIEKVNSYLRQNKPESAEEELIVVEDLLNNWIQSLKKRILTSVDGLNELTDRIGQFSEIKNITSVVNLEKKISEFMQKKITEFVEKPQELEKVINSKFKVIVDEFEKIDNLIIDITKELASGLDGTLKEEFEKKFNQIDGEIKKISKVESIDILKQHKEDLADLLGKIADAKTTKKYINRVEGVVRKEKSIDKGLIKKILSSVKYYEDKYEWSNAKNLSRNAVVVTNTALILQRVQQRSLDSLSDENRKKVEISLSVIQNILKKEQQLTDPDDSIIYTLNEKTLELKQNFMDVTGQRLDTGQVQLDEIREDEQEEPKTKPDSVAGNQGEEDTGMINLPLHFLENTLNAKLRLNIYQYTFLFIGFTISFALGFSMLYLQDPDFGAQILMDYGRIAGWGFIGSEVSSLGVTGLMNKWGKYLTGEKKSTT